MRFNCHLKKLLMMLINQDIHPGAKKDKNVLWMKFFIYFIFPPPFCFENRHISILNFLSEMGISLRSCHSVLTQDLHMCWLLQILCPVYWPTSKCLTVSLYEHITFSSQPHFICTDVCIDSTCDKFERLFS